MSSCVRWYMSSFHSCFLCCFKTCQNNPQQRSLKGMSALWLCKSNWVLYSRFKIFITQKLLTASWFVSVFYGYSCHMQPPQFLIIFYGMCFPPLESLSLSLLHKIFSTGKRTSTGKGLHHWKYSCIITLANSSRVWNSSNFPLQIHNLLLEHWNCFNVTISACKFVDCPSTVNVKNIMITPLLVIKVFIMW